MPPMTEEEQKVFDEMKATNEKLLKDIEGLKSKPPADNPADKADKGDAAEDVLDKVRKMKKDEETQANQIKRIENATRFSMGLGKFLADHKPFLPEEVVKVIGVTEKENYDTTEMRANVIKAAMIKSFFEIQANADLLTSNQKIMLDGFFKLTKTAKEEKASEVYENVFEPTLEMLKRVRKAEEVARANSGFANENDVSSGYRQRLIDRSREIHLGEKGK
jgi:hypothetical protein